MTSVTLTVNSITFTFENGDVDTCKSNIQSNIESSLITGLGPMGAYIYDFEGCSKVIEISGNLTPATTTRTSSGTIKTILEQKQWIESLINGIQGLITFTSNYETKSANTVTGAATPYQSAFTNTTCKVQSMSFDEKGGNPLQLPFRITLTVGQ